MKRLFLVSVDEEGVTMVEYGVMLALIALVLLGSVALLGDKTAGLWSGIQSSLTSSSALNPK